MAAALISLVSLELDIARQLNQHYLGRSFWSAYIPRTNGFSPQQLMVSRNLWQSKSNLKRFKPWADCCLVERKNNMKHPVKTINLNQMYVTATRSPGMQLCKASNKNCLCRPFPKPVESVSLHAIWHKDFCKSLVLCAMLAIDCHVTSYTWHHLTFLFIGFLCPSDLRKTILQKLIRKGVRSGKLKTIW